MRLKTIKLAGFKSFVDATTLHLRGRVTAVVGPNGCGKSNVVDAVRWVLGESSARQLRGEGLADVIFNGSSVRAPLGRASVELIFDNTDGRLQGEYARYAEIAVRREISRDGDSHYYLNGSRCRRRDVVDLFLGTGLGPRSYAIIEQGMIARLIEARPEDLRAHLEEVAGISKYRERRRETEGRISQTRENLSRVQDLRGELTARLSTLERQVRAAERFRALRGEERTTRVQWLAARLRSLLAEVHAREAALSQAQEQGVQAGLGLTQAEAAVEAARNQARGVGEALASAQQAYYGAGAEVARLEQERTSAQVAERRLREEQARAHAQAQELEQQLARTDARLAELTTADAQTAGLRTATEQRLQAAEQTLAGAELALEAARTQAEAAARARGDAAQQAREAETRARDLEQRTARLRAQQQRLAAEAQTLAGDDWAARLEDLDARLGRSRQALRERQEALDEAEDAAVEARSHGEQLAADLASQRGAVEGLRGRITAAQSLQAAALEAEGAIPTAFAQAPVLADLVSAPTALRTALEATLGPVLKARLVDDLDTAAAQAGDARALVFIHSGTPSRAGDEGSLLAAITTPVHLGPQLGNVTPVADLQAALAARAHLPPHGVLVTPQGHRVGPNWLALPPREGQLGVLERVQALAALRAELAEVEAAIATTTAAQSAQAAALAQARATLAEARRAHDALRDELSELAAARAQAEAHHQRVGARAAALAREQQDVAATLLTDEDALRTERTRLESARDHAQALASAEQPAATQRQTAASAVQASRSVVDAARRELAQLDVAAGASAAEARTLRQGQSQWQAQRATAEQRARELAQQAQVSLAPLEALEHQLQGALAGRLNAEQHLARTRSAVEAADGALRSAEQARSGAERAQSDQREVVALRRAAVQEAMAHVEALHEQFAQHEADPLAALAELPADAQEPVLKEQLEALLRSIARLGPVNLAAMDEQRELSEREAYLGRQHDDLAEALATLEQSMARMDRETRALFKSTFEQVNAGFGALFPRLFGGGEARLELLEDDPLEAGVVLVARPPGKRNSSVQSLSGGEKALTAIALVFALFELNPAPFCMLDEVDAPLDENNVARFGELVREMSARVQFVMITHSRTSMEMANELAGVTMVEPGVSRLVAVDLDAAAALVEA